METGQISFQQKLKRSPVKFVLLKFHTVKGLIVKDEFNSSPVRLNFSLFQFQFSRSNSVSYCFQLEVCQLFVTVKLEQQNTIPTNTPLPTGHLSD